ncbi:hypothetical protein EV385_0172 [Krasilnikovia cinnamomea]|uniref:HEAT repeat protein n=1 Tax=Krasilnikovia cinnamomea TaxID=349313 RepID=A0A4V2G6F4_9ACTN|nr:hypothetical protein [Krasilnikovia cinnamomea]RZU48456.1 hypothetical protein EV385_0172 [Krasilnikovia cinnamomea]
MTESADLLAGVDDVPWGRMSHAYGAATTMPERLRELVDTDPAVREGALDFLYGAVHHQGDVYDCTVAAVPFLLRMVADRRRPGRADLVELLASIGNARYAGTLTDAEARANRAVSAAYRMWLGLLTDHVPAVRAATCTALLACRDHAGEVHSALRKRFTEEADARTRTAIVGAVAELARRSGAGAETGAWLAEVPITDPDPGVRVAALTQAIALTPLGGPPVTVADSLTLLTQLGTAPRRRVNLGDEVLGLSHSMGDQVGARIDLLTALLSSPERKYRLSALAPARYLVEGWRADFAPLVGLVGDEVTRGPASCRAAAVEVLERMDVLAAPAADALVGALERSDRMVGQAAMNKKAPWVVAFDSGSTGIGPALRALVGTGDLRAVPMLAWALEVENLPRDVGEYVGRLGEGAAELVPLIVRRWRELPVGDRRRHDLVGALGRIGSAAAVATPDLLAAPLDRGSIGALAGFGPAAREARGQLRDAAATGPRIDAIAAARASWRVCADDAAARTVLARFRDDEYARRDLASLIAEVGAPLADFAPYLRDLLRQDDVWLQEPAAQALWCAAGDGAATMPVLERLWRTNPLSRRVAATVWAQMGPDAATARPLLLAELRRSRRHTAADNARSLTGVRDDEELLTLCRAALHATR